MLKHGMSTTEYSQVDGPTQKSNEDGRAVNAFPRKI